jgi:hypothetical protein
MLRLDNFEFSRDTHAPRATIAEAQRLINVPPTSSFSREASGNSSTLYYNLAFLLGVFAKFVVLF